MTSEDQQKKTTAAKIDTSLFPEGFTEKTGPAAYKEKQTQADEQAQTQTEPVNEGQPAQAPLSDAVQATYEARINTLETELAETKDLLMRAVAEAENTRKRASRERDDMRKFAISSFSKDLLEIADTFGRALSFVEDGMFEEDEQAKNFIDGVKATERVLFRIFERNGIKKDEPLDKAFDPNFHEVMFEVPNTGKPAGTIVQVLESGYLLNGRLLRAAKVGVATGEVSDASPSTDPGSQIDQEV